MELDDNLKQLTKNLGTAINESLSNSEPISKAIASIKDAGYDVFLVLEATIGFNKRGEEAETPLPQGPAGELNLTSQDTRFLKSLKISISGSEEPPRP